MRPDGTFLMKRTVCRVEGEERGDGYTSVPDRHPASRPRRPASAAVSHMLARRVSRRGLRLRRFAGLRQGLVGVLAHWLGVAGLGSNAESVPSSIYLSAA